MEDFYVGQHITHPDHGSCTVTFVGSNYVGIEIDGGGHTLVRKEAFLEAPATGENVVQPVERPLTWPESTFEQEGEEAQHYLGSHWEPFVEERTTFMKKLPEILRRIEPWIGGERRSSPRSVPEGWARGVALAWPNHRQGLIVALTIQEEANLVSGLFPFFSDGGQHSLRLRKVKVWESGVEAQIEADWGDAVITFFDVGFLNTRLWYDVGRDYEFILGGIAYGAQPSTIMQLPFNPNPDELAWVNQLAKERGEEHPSKLNLHGMAMFMPVEEWDVDDYKFRGPVKAVKELDLDVLGQSGWIVKVTVMRFDEGEEAELDILITRRAWQGDEPPIEGQDIEGSLWLQGYLWSA